MRIQLPMKRRWSIYLLLLFLFFSVVFILVQYHSEKKVKRERLNEILQVYNRFIYGYKDVLLTSHSDKDSVNFPYHSLDSTLRFSIIGQDGLVLYDSRISNYKDLPNHADRKEIKEAMYDGKGYDIRKSNSTGIAYYYFAEKYDTVYIRSALPYTSNVKIMLHLDLRTWSYIGFLLLFILLFLIYIDRIFHQTFLRFRRLAEHAEINDKIELTEPFYIQELDEVAQHIANIYNRLNETKQKLVVEKQKLFDHLYISHEGLGIFSSTRHLITYNELFVQYVNLIAKESLQEIHDLFSMPKFAEINAFLDEKLVANIQNTNVVRESVQVSSNGKVFNVQCIIFQDKTFEISINDITEENATQQLKRQLTQNIAHELKTPVSSIQGYLETLLNVENIAPEKQRKFIEHSYAQSVRLAHLVNDIGLLNKMDSVNPLFEREHFDLGKLIYSVFDDVSLEIEKKHVTVLLSLSKELPMYGSKALVYSIFRNMVDNSLAYAGERFSIFINCYHRDENVYYLSYRDSGAGVEKEHLTHLFDRFYRVDKGRSRKMGGTGLGLAIVKHAVQFHHGSILAKIPIGGGLEFLFTLRKE